MLMFYLNGRPSTGLECSRGGTRQEHYLDKKVNKGKKRDKVGSFKRDYIIQKFSKSYQKRKKRGCVGRTIQGYNI